MSPEKLLQYSLYHAERAEGQMLFYQTKSTAANRRQLAANAQAWFEYYAGVAEYLEDALSHGKRK